MGVVTEPALGVGITVAVWIEVTVLKTTTGSNVRLIDADVLVGVRLRDIIPVEWGAVLDWQCEDKGAEKFLEATDGEAEIIGSLPADVVVDSIKDSGVEVATEFSLENVMGSAEVDRRVESSPITGFLVDSEGDLARSGL